MTDAILQHPPTNVKVLYTAAHGGFAGEPVPLGGGAAVFEHLVEEWTRTQPFELRTITPSVMGPRAPRGVDVVRFGERAYAEFSRAFERASTEEILRHDPEDVAVLVNDISEGPDFAALGQRGYRLYTIYHVDVVAYVTEMYLRGWVPPEATVRWYRRLRRLMPDMAGLIWAKQEASVQWSRGLIVPSAGMKDVLLRCYPECPAEKIHVLPWGNWNEIRPPSQEHATALRREFGVPDEARVLLALSRISPEKGQDVLLDALFEWERRDGYPSYPVWMFVCGDAAFMQGERFLHRLKKQAARLRRTWVVFPGYVTGERKRSFFAMTDLYVFPSRHESYGLTLLEALAAGVPAVCLDTAGARSVMRPEFGAIIRREELCEAIARLLNDAAVRARMSEAARAYAQKESFAQRAGQLARLVMGERVVYPV